MTIDAIDVVGECEHMVLRKLQVTELPHESNSVEEFVRLCLHDASIHGCDVQHHPLSRAVQVPTDGATAPTRFHARTKELANKVLHDSDGAYSVRGYNERARQLFGEIFLGLDKGCEYDRQATKINSAIQALSAGDAFQKSLEATRSKLKSKPGVVDEAVFVAVLAHMCTLWFDLPDGVEVIEGGARVSTPPQPPALCPLDYGVPSACMFYADGNKLITEDARTVGRILHEAHARYIARLRSSGEKPKGVISRAVFEAFPEAEDDLIARSIIGVMMGMLPTTYFNLKFVLEAWRAQGGTAFTKLQDKLRAHQGKDGYERALFVLAEPMFQTMQGRPMPPEVWRTATKDHKLGAESVREGDQVVVDIASVTAADLEKGKTDVFVVFGGDRSARNHPTHACPGYEAAVAIMLGTISGLMESDAAA